MVSAEDKDIPLVMDTRQVDASYDPFPLFDEWVNIPIGIARWEAFAAEVSSRRTEASPELLKRAQEIVERAAAIDTGAIEGLYDVDRGFTFSVAKQVTTWEAMIDQKGEDVRDLFESQLSAYESVLDLATKSTPVTEAWIRQLHAEICRAQDTYLVQTPTGPQKQELPKGEYKHLPNHVRGRDGEIHAYAPVDMTPEEMHRLCEEVHSEAFQKAHPVLQASYIHYAFVVIHPFADGNGRVARALASIYTYRSHSVPLLILADTRNEYISALEAADKKNLQPFVNFTLERALDGIQLVQESINAAKSPEASDAISRLKKLYVTKGGYTHEEIDNAGFILFDSFVAELQKQIQPYSSVENLGIVVASTHGNQNIRDARYRHPINQTRQRQTGLHVSSSAPATAGASRDFSLEVPRDANEQAGPLIRNIETGDSFQVRVEEVAPVVSAAVQIRLAMFVERFLGITLNELSEKASQKLREQGY